MKTARKTGYFSAKHMASGHTFSGVQIISYKVDWRALNCVSNLRTAVQKLRYKNY